MDTFFSSAYTNLGFRHFKLNSINPDCFRYIIKGKSGGVISRCFERFSEKLEKSGAKFCVSRNYDGNLTGISCEEKGFIICNGTAPFSQEAVTFGATDSMISLETFQQSKRLRENADEIRSLMYTFSENERRCCRFLNAANGIYKDNMRLGKEINDSRKVSRYTAKLWSRYGSPPSGKIGVEKKLFYNVLSQEGVMSAKGLNEICDTAIVIDDNCGYCSDMIIDRMRRYALSNGVDVLSFIRFFDYNAAPECIVMPALRFGVFCECNGSEADAPYIKTVKARRFLHTQPGESVKVRLQFNQKAMDSLIKEAASSLKEIQRINDELDSIYSQATDEDAFFDYIYLKTLKGKTV